MLFVALVSWLLQTCDSQMWTGGGGNTGSGAQNGGAGSWNAQGQGMGMGFGPPGGFGPIPAEFQAAMTGFTVQPPPLPRSMLGGTGMMGGVGMMGGTPGGMMGAQGTGMMGGQSTGMMGQPSQGMMGGHGQGLMGGHGQGMMGNMLNGGMMAGMNAHTAGAAGSHQKQVKTTKKPAVEYEPPEHPVTTKSPKGKSVGQSSGAAISSPGQIQNQPMNNMDFQQKAMQHQQMQNQMHRQYMMQMQNANMQQQMGQGAPNNQQFSQEKFGIMTRFSNSMNQMMSTFNSIRASLAKLIQTLSKFVKSV